MDTSTDAGSLIAKEVCWLGDRSYSLRIYPSQLYGDYDNGEWQLERDDDPAHAPSVMELPVEGVPLKDGGAKRDRILNILRSIK